MTASAGKPQNFPVGDGCSLPRVLCCPSCRLVAVPPRAGALAAVWLVAFSVAAGDLACSILVVLAGVTTVPIRVFGLLHAGVDDQVAGICLVMLAGFMLLSAAVWHLLARTTEAMGRSDRQ